MQTIEPRPFAAATNKFAFAQVFTVPSTRRAGRAQAKRVVRAGRLSVLRRHSHASHTA